MKKLLLICSIATVITGCANEALIKETQSGKAEAYAETQMALGQVRKEPLDGNKTRNELQRALDEGIKNILKNNQ